MSEQASAREALRRFYDRIALNLPYWPPVWSTEFVLLLAYVSAVERTLREGLRQEEGKG